jgi:mono/diheme cytochrome c family protein
MKQWWTAMLLCGALVVPAYAQQADQAKVDSGLRVWKEFGNCWFCHGWAGTGGLPDVIGDANAGPPVNVSRMDRAQMLDMVSCGRLGGQHPAYAAAAWTAQHPCYGKTRADVPADQMPPLSDTRLTEGQIDAVVTYVQEFYQGKQMTRAKCLRYFGATQSIVCDPFP